MRVFTNDQQLRTTAPKNSTGDDPLLRLQHESEPDHPRIRFTTHTDPITITGITVMCPACAVRRDWMVICDVPGRVFLRCRCAHQWHEPELTRADFDAMIDAPDRKYPSLEAAARHTGHDGTLAGTYLPGDLDAGMRY
ncbi:hypothetical protein C3486_02165 [Streptomyces sp. Ru73]|uniref:hypothetical protein n=1 Tax=Streptomyces sp. Ru73 TaxID=2080748 RepID=UPI000CDD056F|nr:hypothetical protein [Streptomyces sp. Ru73]POX43048.1 hypothetical protein C3486_02165 [Streptomyces sp. Ru73]